jgi:hypothetical protein
MINILKKIALILVVLMALVGIGFLFYSSEDPGRYVEFGGKGGAVLDTKTGKIYGLNEDNGTVFIIDVLEEAKKSEQ